MAVRIEDAGFEIRDMIAWVYGSGFPKSLDVSKAIDKMDAAQEQQARRYRFTEWVRSTGITSKQIDEATQTNMGGHYTTAASQPAIMTREHLEACRHLLGEIPEWVEREADIRSVESKNFAEREVIGKMENPASSIYSQSENEMSRDVPITAPATHEAKQWQGWGTALKPALEPITVARKPLIGTVAENVLQHGTGAINVDGCRVAFVSDADRRESTAKNQHAEFGTQPMTNNNVYGDYSMIQPANYNPPGRWPANFIHDGSEEVVGLFPETGASRAIKGGANRRAYREHEITNPSGWKEVGRIRKDEGYDDAGGSAARFFYCAKASKRDRDEGNHHPTVKPTDLMRYLCRLVTPPDGLVLDPFMGSGSTGKAAALEGFSFIGIEREAEYVAIAQARINHVTND
jgi:hypothetical protein